MSDTNWLMLSKRPGPHVHGKRHEQRRREKRVGAVGCAAADIDVLSLDGKVGKAVGRARVPVPTPPPTFGCSPFTSADKDNVCQGILAIVCRRGYYVGWYS